MGGSLTAIHVYARALGVLAALAALGACTKPEVAAPAVVPAVLAPAAPDNRPEWRRLASPADNERIDRLDQAWEEGLRQARAARFTTALEEEGALVDPAAALPWPAPSPGPYRCRVVKLGTSGDPPAFRTFKPFFCYVQPDGEYLNIVKQTGTQRPAGWLYPAQRPNRMVFLGTLALGDEQEPLAYGADPKRDMAGVFERIGPFRYRMVIPWPQLDSKLDIIELVPVIE
jgi:hypothetical protein